MAKWTKARIDRVRRAYDEYKRYVGLAKDAIAKIDVVMQETEKAGYCF